MTKDKCLFIAEQYLISREIGFLPSGRIGQKEENRWEVIFPVPETLDPNIAVIDPPDVRVWVRIDDGAVEFIQQM